MWRATSSVIFRAHLVRACQWRRWWAEATHAHWYQERVGIPWIARSWCTRNSTCRSAVCRERALEWCQVLCRIYFGYRCIRSRSPSSHFQSRQRQCLTCPFASAGRSRAWGHNVWCPGTSYTWAHSATRLRNVWWGHTRILDNCTFWWIRRGSQRKARRCSIDGSWRQSSHVVWRLSPHYQGHSLSEVAAI